MNLQERYDECDSIIYDFRSRLDIAFPSPTELMLAIDSAKDFALSWTGEHLARPDGSPADVQSSAEGLEDIAGSLDELTVTLETRASQIETAINADAGRADAVRTRAFISLADIEARGIRLVSAALKIYATSLDQGQTSIHLDAAAVESAKRSVGGLMSPDGVSDMTPEQCADTMKQMRDLYFDAEQGLIACRDTFGDVMEAERRLSLVYGDAAGYARLWDLPPSKTTTVADAVLALVDGVANPDRAVVSDAEWAAYVAARDALSAEERTQLDDALAGARSPDERQIVVSALATGAGLALTLALGVKLKTMTANQVSKVAGLGLHLVDDEAASEGAMLSTDDGTALKQQTDTTCGSAALLVLAAQRDPFLALLLAEGEFVDGHVPGYVSDVPLLELLPGADATPSDRLTYLQDQIRIQTNEGTFWPGAKWGSAPWGYGDEVSRVLGTDVDIDYDVLSPIDDPQELVDRAITAVDAGTPVPFLVGGDWGPRHYVVLVGHSGGDLQFYEPVSGEVRTVPLTDAVHGGGDSIAAFGGWSSINGAALPSN